MEISCVLVMSVR